jgi:hypothetical protein
MIFLAACMFMVAAGISGSMAYFYSIKKKSGVGKEHSKSGKSGAWQRLVILTAILWIVVALAMSLSIRAYVIEGDTSLEEIQVTQFPELYEFYRFLVIHVTGGFLVYLHGKKRDDSAKKAVEVQAVAAKANQADTTLAAVSKDQHSKLSSA